MATRIETTSNTFNARKEYLAARSLLCNSE